MTSHVMRKEFLSTKRKSFIKLCLKIFSLASPWARKLPWPNSSDQMHIHKESNQHKCPRRPNFYFWRMRKAEVEGSWQYNNVLFKDNYYSPCGRWSANSRCQNTKQFKSLQWRECHFTQLNFCKILLVGYPQYNS